MINMKVIVYDLDAKEDEEYEWLFKSKKEAINTLAWWIFGDKLEGKKHYYVIEKYEEVD